MKKLLLGAFIAAMSSGVAMAGGFLICDDIPTQTDLIAGRHIDAGDVVVASDGTFLYVTILTENGWVLTETHVAVGDTQADIPQNKAGCPQNGLFPYSSKHNGATMHVVAIPLNSFNHDGTITIAVHAVVQKIEGSRRVTETAWGQGNSFRCRNWAMTLEHTIADCF
ncbi:MAG TPA: hypothetical protein PKE26_12765 [Kiritimatiellia bacterium]|nr:hypothetical protein [Kiritimatiellia bacterium]HMO99974.1 hypothetical protein [Kiritimatiellia bacterium]HMP96917.1 hypothetical protein [Kiritimatiellia bacterium]